jgi:hypothetical protein
MNQDQIIAERELLFITPEGKEIQSSIELSKPYISEKYGTLCDFEIPKVHKKQWGAGIDGIQAIILTMSIVKTVLSLKADKGWKIYWPDTKEEIQVHEIFDVSSLLEDPNDN